MPRQFAPLSTGIGPFTYSTATGKWMGPTGAICDEIGNYFDLPDSARSFWVHGSLTAPADGRPFHTITLSAPQVAGQPLSYNCDARGDKTFKVQEALRPLANKLWESRGHRTTLPVYVSLSFE